VAAHGIEQGLVSGFPVAEAGDVVAEFGLAILVLRLSLGAGACQNEVIALDGENLPAAAWTRGVGGA
jgi:hypothetical protein